MKRSEVLGPRHSDGDPTQQLFSLCVVPTIPQNTQNILSITWKSLLHNISNKHMQKTEPGWKRLPLRGKATNTNIIKHLL